MAVIPFIYYDDPAAAIEFLKDAFGFDEHEVHRTDAGEIDHAELRLGDGMIMPGAPSAFGMSSAKQLGGSNQGNYVVISDPDDHCERARAAGAEIIEEPVDREYGSREYTARDFDGNVWVFGTYDPFG